MPIRFAKPLSLVLAPIIAAACFVSPFPADSLLPLTRQEQEALVGEIRMMIKTDVDKVAQ